MSEEPHSRRAFFRQVVKRYVEPAVDYLDSRGQEDGVAPSYMRPPGAIAEPDFLNRCERCHACVSACPADAIQPLDIEEVKGTPAIVASVQACVVCTDLDCMPACPSGALQVIPRAQIAMGLAVVDVEICVRSKGEWCQSCVDLCPMSSRAIEIGSDDRVNVLEGCVGCGVCEQVCPTTPKAIVIAPNTDRLTANPSDVIQRQGARALLLTPDRRVLLMQMKEPDSGVVFWITPGGGLESGESETVGLLRELSEEVGKEDYAVGPAIWKHVSRFTWNGQQYEQQQTYYLIETESFDPGNGGQMDENERDALKSFRWWSAKEILDSDETFTPRRLGKCLEELLERLERGDELTEVIDV
jgi:ferredoxin-type protein NapG